MAAIARFHSEHRHLYDDFALVKPAPPHRILQYKSTQEALLVLPIKSSILALQQIRDKAVATWGEMFTPNISWHVTLCYSVLRPKQDLVAKVMREEADIFGKLVIQLDDAAIMSRKLVVKIKLPSWIPEMTKRIVERLVSPGNRRVGCLPSITPHITIGKFGSRLPTCFSSSGMTLQRGAVPVSSIELRGIDYPTYQIKFRRRKRSSRAASSSPETDAPLRLEITIPKEAIGHVIGKKGAHIQELQRSRNIQSIHFRPATDTVEILAFTRLALVECRDKIEKKIQLAAKKEKPRRTEHRIGERSSSASPQPGACVAPADSTETEIGS